ncbi:ATP-binding cassette domain-containing protein [Nocardia rhizosphaerae]|uniref:ATP-binding cassette domain-containing protein n=1 Tax=Nocardia rhizosphaerae TaxID=1691571 RepID=A0ABV8L4B0_9NOCA
MDIERARVHGVAVRRRGVRVAGWWRWSVGAAVALVLLLAVAGPLLAPYPAERAVGMPFAEPGGAALLGTDRLGRDVLSHLLTGGFELLMVSAVIAATVTVLSAVLGAVAAVRPRAAAVIALGGDLLILLPAVLGILLVLTAWPQGGVGALIVVSLLFGVPYCARIFAAAAAGIAANGYVEAAIASGESLPHLVFREILPNLRAVFTTQLGLRFVVAVYLVSTVAFLGVPALDDDNWANMVRDNASGLLLNPVAVLAPSAAIAVVAVGVNLVVTGGIARNPTVIAAGQRACADDARATAADADQLEADGRPESGADVVVVEGLSVVAETGAVLLAPLSFRLRPGTVTALTGASGAGKSTAMRALLGHIPAGARRAGSVRVAGHEVFALDPGALRMFRRTRIAYVGQDPGSELNPLLRVRTVLAEAAPTASDADRRAAVERVGLDLTHLRRRCGRLSGGQQRRVALARAFLRHPEVVVLDEPLAGLHGALRTEIARLISDLATDSSTAVLLSGHDTTTIHAIADTVIEVRPPGGWADGPGSGVGRMSTGSDRPGSGVGQTSTGSAVGPGADTGGPAGNSADQADPTMPNGRPDPSGAVGQHGGPVDVAVSLGSDAGQRRGRDGDATALRADGISATVDGHPILTGIHFTVRPGAALAVVGPSGAGKTTLARVIAGLHRSASGTIEVRGTRIPIGRKRRITAGANGIALVTQNPLAALNPQRTVGQTLARPLRRIARVPDQDIPARVESLLHAVELPADFATRRPGELSGGQRQRVALARALAADPAVLICDEITTALDSATATAIMTLLDHLRATRDTAVVLISHDMALVTRHCTVLVVLDQGRIVESGTTATVLSAPSHRATADLLG